MKIEIHNTTYIFLLISFLAGYFEYMYILLLIIFIHETGHYILAKINKVEIAYQNQNNNLSTLTATKILSLNPKIIFPGHDHYIRNKKMKKSFNRI